MSHVSGAGPIATCGTTRGPRLADAVRSGSTWPARVSALDGALRVLAGRRRPESTVENWVLAASLSGCRRGGPKEFQRLTRIQHATRTLLLGNESRYPATALDAGFYDQNHFIREFRRFTGRNPAATLGVGLSHFYYESSTVRHEDGAPTILDERRHHHHGHRNPVPPARPR